jgi:hypothetical protein
MPRSLFILSILLSQPVFALHDPTRPTDPSEFFGTHATTSSTWSLQSILSSPQRHIAIINGTRVREGDSIGTAKVLSITASQVLLNTGGHTLTLRLRPQPIKVTP